MKVFLTIDESFIAIQVPYETFIKLLISDSFFSIQSGDKSQKFNDQYNVLDISSGILHLAGDSLIPQSITKNCLQDAKVLQQVDKKFIPVVADGTLAIIDQVHSLSFSIS